MNAIEPTSRRSLLLLLLTAITAGLLILFGAVLPAEYGRDPLGIGRITGLSALWRQPEVEAKAGSSSGITARSYPTAYRSDVVDIELGTLNPEDDNNQTELEYKVHLKQGGSFIYGWEASGMADPAKLYSEFHGHTISEGKAITVANYRKAEGLSDNGVLVAPFDGVHGWYFQNRSDRTVKIRLRISGFYDLIPPGSPGNEAGLIAKPAAS